MSDPEKEVLSTVVQGELRHTLRTPFNALLGYTEMLLETASEDGLDALVPGLERIHSDSREMLAQVNDALASEQAVGIAELQVLGQQINQRVPALAQEIDAALVASRDLSAEDATEVIERLQRAAIQLRELTQKHLLAGELPTEPTGTAPPPGLEVDPESGPTVRPVSAVVSGKVLVVDDSETNRDLLCRRLEREGYTTATAVNGRAALERLAAESFDLVLLDLLMPEMSGYEVLRTLKSSDRWRDIPVIMISALDEMASVVLCIEAGAEDYLSKPFDPVLLRARVGACLEKKRLRDKELEYLRGVQELELAASAVEAGSFVAEKLEGVASRQDELGKLARVFQRMASEVQAREQKLKQQVEQLRIEIDMVKLSQQVSEVTSSDVFATLEGARERLRKRRGGQI